MLDDDAWDLLWEKTADRPAETEALLAGDLPEDLLEAVEDARVRMLPGYGDLDADCDCDCDGLDHPCPHATALAYQLSWLLDADPWLLLLIRGRAAEEAVEELKSALLLRALAGDEEEKDPGRPRRRRSRPRRPPRRIPARMPPSARPTPAQSQPCPPCRRCPNRPPRPRSR
ncbi:hypothetical protein ACFQZ0_01950 [Streptomyces erythrogriseus]